MVSNSQPGNLDMIPTVGIFKIQSGSSAMLRYECYP